MKRIGLVAALGLSCASPPNEGACVGIIEVTTPTGALDPSGAWVVGGWRGDRVHYPAFTTLAIPHGLGREPTDVDCWVSFTADGAMAEQSGNVCQVLPRCETRNGITTREVLLRNAGAQDFWARFVIR